MKKEKFNKLPISFQDIIKISDKRDIIEMNKRIKKKTFQPLRDKLYSINPTFNGNYSDPWNR